MQDRIHEIKAVVDEQIRRIQNWAQDTTAPPAVPPEIALSIQEAELICHAGDIPQCCQELVTAVSRMSVEQGRYEGYEEGYRQRDDAPVSSWWAAAQGVIRSRQGVEQPKIVRLESVRDLLKQGVSRMQIAGCIYGRRNVGPLMQENGVPDDFLIDKEAETPGSVLKNWPDWVPPWMNQIANEQKSQLASQLEVLDKRKEGRPRYQDPGSIEDMLRDKCYIQQIMYGKQCSREDVQAVADEIGVVAYDQPGFIPTGQLEDEEAPPRGNELTEAREAMSKKAAELWEANQNLGAAEIAQMLREQGVEMSTKSVAQAITWHKRRKPAEVPA